MGGWIPVAPVFFFCAIDLKTLSNILWIVLDSVSSFKHLIKNKNQVREAKIGEMCTCLGVLVKSQVTEFWTNCKSCLAKSGLICKSTSESCLHSDYSNYWFDNCLIVEEGALGKLGSLVGYQVYYYHFKHYMDMIFLPVLKSKLNRVSSRKCRDLRN